MNNIISNLKLAGSALALAGVLASPVAANDVDGIAADQSQGGLQDIVVTARKRSESVQDVPVAVTALSAEQIAQKDLTSLEKVAASTPNFSVGRASNGSGATLTLRGIGSSATSIGIEQSVAVVVDGVYYGQGRVINEGFFDLARLEILKGPQALFFGKNATAGVVSITTADPTPDWEFTARTAYELRSEQAQVEAIASGPLSDTLGIRVAVRGSKMWGGYFRNVADPVTLNTLDIATGTLTPHTALPAPRDQPGEKELLGRLTLKWTPDERLTATLKLSGTRSETNNSSWNYVPYNCATGSSSLNPAVTGSTATGKAVMRSAAGNLKRVTLELGGNDPAIVLPDADVEAVIPRLFWAAFANAGQICIASKRIYVHESLYDRFATAMVDYAKSVKVGDGTEQGVQIGPIQNRPQFDRVRALLADARSAGTRFLLGGDVPEGQGYFVPIAIADNPDEKSRVVAEEAFGPVLPLLKFSNVDEVVARANDSPYGLAASVWGTNLEAAQAVADRIEAGTVWINTVQDLGPGQPFGGHKQSGLGVENGREGLLEYCNPQVIVRCAAPA